MKHFTQPCLLTYRSEALKNTQKYRGHCKHIWEGTCGCLRLIIMIHVALAFQNFQQTQLWVCLNSLQTAYRCAMGADRWGTAERGSCTNAKWPEKWPTWTPSGGYFCLLISCSWQLLCCDHMASPHGAANCCQRIVWPFESRWLKSPQHRGSCHSPRKSPVASLLLKGPL